MKNVLVKIGKIHVGKGCNLAVQTMCNTSTSDVSASYNQCVELYKAGADIIRLTTQGIREVEALDEIKTKLKANGIDTPLVADVHFSYEVALAAAKVAHKVRINPGNFAKDHIIAKREFSNLISVCKEFGTSLRIGINHGSLGERIVNLYGDTPHGMAEAALEWMEMADENNFDQLVFSLKSSNTVVMTKAYRLLHNRMLSRGVIYPLHLGVTEAGNGDEGRIKSASAIATLLKEGIGETIRVSLTENPVNEIVVANFIRDFFNKGNNLKESYNVTVKDGLKIALVSYKSRDYNDFILTASCELGPLLIDRVIDDIELKAIINQETVSQTDIDQFRDNLLQATRRKFTKPEYIACPGCGRTLFDIEKIFNEVKQRTAHLTGYNIAVMGCIVNGPGEMADADYGYVGEGRNKVSIYRGKEPVYRSVPQEKAIDKLLELIEEDSRNKLFRPRNV
ncbi:MAG: (E)-4-hydroxy-3-methylbut-2-enyl-diphosphate synthase [Bacteroidales bacterium]